MGGRDGIPALPGSAVCTVIPDKNGVPRASMVPVVIIRLRLVALCSVGEIGVKILRGIPLPRAPWNSGGDVSLCIPPLLPGRLKGTLAVGGDIYADSSSICAALRLRPLLSTSSPFVGLRIECTLASVRDDLLSDSVLACEDGRGGGRTGPWEYW
jgi:hypothetical protein